MGDRAFFFCAKSDSALVPFGTVTLQPGHVTLPLLVRANRIIVLSGAKAAEEDPNI